ncbi:uncharacterized protein LOC117180724 [Belonocnema kinseyi]|uniref:uncharacterized protein LOC117180724 n=1 Tax=Belonocnema kinseyi TaxID=2817044 RepID=UPI00143CC0E2|nr:uncharacterized protein LOC117180724 [Belonocnema kinseyi]
MSVMRAVIFVFSDPGRSCGSIIGGSSLPVGSCVVLTRDGSVGATEEASLSSASPPSPPSFAPLRHPLPGSGTPSTRTLPPPSVSATPPSSPSSKARRCRGPRGRRQPRLPHPSPLHLRLATCEASPPPGFPGCCPPMISDCLRLRRRPNGPTLFALCYRFHHCTVSTIREHKDVSNSNNANESVAFVVDCGFQRQRFTDLTQYSLHFTRVPAAFLDRSLAGLPARIVSLHFYWVGLTPLFVLVAPARLYDQHLHSQGAKVKATRTLPRAAPPCHPAFLICALFSPPQQHPLFLTFQTNNQQGCHRTMYLKKVEKVTNLRGRS